MGFTSVTLVLCLPHVCFAGADVNELRADINFDGIVNFHDLSFFAQEWLMSGSSKGITRQDISKDFLPAIMGQGPRRPNLYHKPI